MKVFGNYAYYYDKMYHDKDYKKEVLTVDSLISKYCIFKGNTILNLGSGTGKHDFELNKLGYKTTGNDLSHEMIAIANESKRENREECIFEQGDIRSYTPTMK